MAPAKDPIVVLKRKRGEIKSRMTKLKHYLANADDSPDVDSIEVKVEALTKHFKNLYSINEDLIEQDAASADIHKKEAESMEDEYEELLIQARKLVRKANGTQTPNCGTPLPIASTSSATPQIIVAQTSTRLPELTLQKFDGSVEKWHGFKDKFITRIDNNDKLSDVDKLQYLQSLLTGKAARAIESLESTSANYKEAWSILTNKYDNARRAILQHWAILNQLPRLTRDAPSALDELVDTFRQHLRALKGLGEPVEEWNTCIIYLMLNKISENTRYVWETSLTDNKMPLYTNLFEFLERRGCCTEQYSSYGRETNKQRQYKTNTKGRGQNREQGQSFVTTSNKKVNETSSTCPVCKEAHTIFRCPAFKSMSTMQRKQQVTDAALCLNCLNPGHLQKDCAARCKVCHNKHNAFLHPFPSAPNRPVEATATVVTSAAQEIITKEA